MPVEELREHAGFRAGAADRALPRLEAEASAHCDRDTVATAGRTVPLTEAEQGIGDELAARMVRPVGDASTSTVRPRRRSPAGTDRDTSRPAA